MGRCEWGKVKDENEIAAWTRGPGKELVGSEMQE